MLRRFLIVREMMQADMSLLALRFVLQPCRVLAAASVLCRVHKMQLSTTDIAFDILENVDSAPPTPQSQSLTPELQVIATES
mmetsp:Transcript_37705/g.80124  ORF Transcript_37705/g.80124 Transcript_37705/m.80124 type:complete len:82 (-) Transcript_37705:7-252(-)